MAVNDDVVWVTERILSVQDGREEGLEESLEEGNLVIGEKECRCFV